MAAPNQGIIDNFNRANGALGAGWASPMWPGDGSPTISSNQVVGTSGYSEAYRSGATYTASEAYLTIATPPGNGQIIEIYARIQSPNAAGLDYYAMAIQKASGTDSWQLQRTNDQSITTLASGSQEFGAGDSIGVVVLGTGATVTIQAWHRPAGGSWTQLGSDYSDTAGNRITAAGFIGFGLEGTTSRIDDFGGGEQSAGSNYSLAVSRASASTTPDTAATSVARPLAASRASASTTPNTAALVTPGTWAVSVASQSATPDDAPLAVARPLAASRASASATWDAVVLGRGRTGLRFYGTADNQVDRVRIPLTVSGGTVATPINVGAGDWAYELWLRCSYADNATAATDVRYSNIVLDRDIWDDARGHVPLGVTRRDGVLVLIFGANDGSGAWPAIRGTTQVGDGAWHHVAVVRDGATVRLFVDGVQDASGTFSTASWAYPTGYTPTGGLDNEYLVLGCEKHDFDPGVGGYSGYVDELRISTTARYTSTFTPPSEPLVPDAATAGLYHLDDAAGTVAADSAQASGSPVAGELLVGGPDSGPTWEAQSPFGGSTYALAVARASASATPDTAALAALRALVSSRASASTTPDTPAASVARPLAASLASLSATPDTAAASVARLLAASSASASTTPDTAALATLRPLAASLASASAIPDTAALSTALRLALARTSVSTTSDAAALAVGRPLAAAASSASATPDGAALALSLTLAVSRPSASATPDGAELSTALRLAVAAASLSATPDIPPLAVARALAAAAGSASGTPAAALDVARALALAAASASSTPDTATLATATVRSIALAAASLSTAPDAAALAVGRALGASAAGQSLTPDVAALAVAHTLDVARASSSLTPDAAALLTAAVQGRLRLVAGAPRQPSLTAGAPRQPSLTATKPT